MISDSPWHDLGQCLPNLVDPIKRENNNIIKTMTLLYLMSNLLRPKLFIQKCRECVSKTIAHLKIEKKVTSLEGGHEIEIPS